MRSRRSELVCGMGLVASLLLGCGSGSVSESNGSSAGGSGGGSSTGGLTSQSGGDGGTTSGGSTSSSGTGGSTASGGTGGSTASGGTGGVCSWDMGLPGPPALQGWGWMSELHDMNGDGIPDIVAAIDNPSGAMHVRLGDGSGGFGDPIVTVVANDTIRVKVAEMNGDAIPDVVVFGGAQPFFQVLTGNGDGSFVVSDPIPTLDSPSTRFVVDDLSGDGRADVAIDVGPPGLQVWLQTAAGTLGAPAIYSTSTLAFVAPQAADLNGDGARDLVWSAPDDNGACDFWTLPGAGNGTFGAPKKLGIACIQGDLALGDLNEDGRTDVVTSGPLGAPITFLQKVDGTFGPGIDSGLRATGALLDFNGDGHVDSVNTEEIGLGAGDGTFPTRRDMFLTGCALATADLDLDGHTDLVGVHRGLVFPLLAGPDGSLPQPVKINDALVEDVTLGDLGGDGIADLVVVGADGLRIAEGLGGGDFSDLTSLDLGAAEKVATLDLNGDKRLDLVVIAASSAYLSAFLQQDGGTFSPVGDTGLPWTGARVVPADLNGDGLGDLVVKARSPAWHWGLSVLLGHGDGEFSATKIQENDGYRDAVVGDVDGDGLQDIVASRAGPPIQVLRGHGDGTFEPPAEIPGVVGMTLHLADLNGDGSLDLVARRLGDAIETHLNHGDGTFGEGVVVDWMFGWDGSLWDTSEDFSAHDVNGDGVLDLVVHRSPPVYVCTGHGDGTFEPCLGYPSCGTSATIAASDLNGDGRTDFVQACQSSPGLARMMSTTCGP